MDLAQFFAEITAPAETSSPDPFPAFPVSRNPNGNGQPIEDKQISRVSRVSRDEIGDIGFGDDSWRSEAEFQPEAARAREVPLEAREMREQRETPAVPSTYISRSPIEKREKEEKTGNDTPLAPQTPPGPLAREWCAGLLTLSQFKLPCPGYRDEEWARVYREAMAFLDGFGAQAEALGWTTKDLFAVHPTHGVIRPDACGALVLGVGGPVRLVTAREIRFGHLTHRWKPGQTLGVPIWEVGK